ncbi:MAG: hypothetical protein V2A72_02980 [Candidatus Omnitrophota bacterium]
MKKTTNTVLIITVAVVLAFVVFLKTPLLKQSIRIWFKWRFKQAELSINKLSFSFTQGIKAKNISLRDKSNTKNINIEDAVIKCNFLYLFKDELYTTLDLKSVKILYPASGVVQSIVNLLALDPAIPFDFDTIEGVLYLKRNEVTIRGLKAQGKDLSVFIDGTATAYEYVNCTIRLLLSDKITSNAPENVRKFLFKTSEEQSMVELYVSGSIKKPYINFSAPLFKLKIT